MLGCSNRPKIDALERDYQSIAARRVPLVMRLETLGRQRDAARERNTRLAELAVFDSFRELDWRPLVTEIERLDRERRELEEGSDILRTLQQQLGALEGSMKETEGRLVAQRKEHAQAEERRERARELREACEALLAGTSAEVKADLFPRLESMSATALEKHVLTVESCENREREMREWR